jgi:hypothetical protein
MATATDPTQTPLTWEQIQAKAEADAAAQIQGQNAPLQARVTSLGGQQTAAAGAITQEFQGLLPYVAASSGRIGQAYGAALTAEQQVFAAAGTRMNQLRQQQASEAQQLAQQMGGPVATGQFTQAMEPYEQALGASGAGSMLHTLGMGQAGVQEAEQFAGQVFPALQTEQVAQSDNFYKNQIKDLQGQIDANAAGKSALVGKEQSDLLASERAFRLQQLQSAMDKTKAQRDWKVQQQQIAASKLSGKLSKGAAKRAGISLGLQVQGQKMSEQRLQAEIQHMSRADQLAAERLGLSKAEFVQRVQHQQQSVKAGATKLSDSIQKDAITLVQAAMGGGKPVSRTYRAYVPGAAGKNRFHPPSGAYWDPKKGQYYRIGHETMTASEWQQQTGEGGDAQHPITDPNRLYDYMRGSLPQLGRKHTINLIRAQTGMKNWSPGQKTNYTGHDLQVMPISELKGLARIYGMPSVGGAKTTRQNLVDFILSHVHTGGHPGQNP